MSEALDFHLLLDVLSFRVAHNTRMVLAGTILLGVACGAIGTFLLLRKRSLVADALSHAALPGVCTGFIAAVLLGWPAKAMWVLLPAAAAFALLGVAGIHLLTTLPRVREDAAIGVVLSVFFAVGVVLLSVIQSMATGTQAGLKQFIFGQAAAMGSRDATLIGLIGLLVVAVVAVNYKELRLLCFDAGFAASIGRPTLLLDAVLLSSVTAVTVVGLYAVGAILMVALLVIPPAAARFWTLRLLPTVLIAAGIGGLGCYLGTAASAVIADLPTGPSIVTACGALFAVSMLAAPRRGLAAAALRRRRLARTVARHHLLRALWEQGEIAGGHELPVRAEALAQRRSWSGHMLPRLLRRLRRRGEVRRADGGWALTDRGRRAAERVVRTHRLWEFYLTRHADVAPSHVDHLADDIEHVLGDALVERLEAQLRDTGALPEERRVPRSPHELAAGGPGR